MSRTSPYGPPVVSGSSLYGLLASTYGIGNGAIYTMDVNGNNYQLWHDFAGKPTDGANLNGPSSWWARPFTA